jgi:hypothetical protein
VSRPHPVDAITPPTGAGYECVYDIRQVDDGWGVFFAWSRRMRTLAEWTWTARVRDRLGRYRFEVVAGVISDVEGDSCYGLKEGVNFIVDTRHGPVTVPGLVPHEDRFASGRSLFAVVLEQPSRDSPRTSPRVIDPTELVSIWLGPLGLAP